MGRAVSGGLLGLALLLLLGLPQPSVYAQDTTTVQGVISNGTPGAEVPVALTVTLDVYRLGERIESMNTVSDASGNFSFEGVPGEFGIGYILSTQYAGGFYFFEKDFPLPPEPVELLVYESTSDGEAVRVKVHTLVVNGADADTGLMNVLALVGLENSGDRTFVPDAPQAGMMSFLRFSLPPLAGEVDVQSNLRGGSVIQIDLGFAMTTPIPPGSYEIAYTYQTAYEGGKLSYTQSFPFGADTFRVLLLSGLGSVSGNGLEETEQATLGDQDYTQLEAKDLDVGARVDLEFSGLPQPPLWKRWQKSASQEGFVQIAIPSAFGVALLSLLGYVLLQRREPAVAVAGALGDPAQRSALVEAMARLDDSFQRRELEEGEYLRQRRALKDQAMRGIGDPGEKDKASGPQPEEGKEAGP